MSFTWYYNDIISILLCFDWLEHYTAMPRSTHTCPNQFWFPYVEALTRIMVVEFRILSESGQLSCIILHWIIIDMTYRRKHNEDSRTRGIWRRSTSRSIKDNVSTPPSDSDQQWHHESMTQIRRINLLIKLSKWWGYFTDLA